MYNKSIVFAVAATFSCVALTQPAMAVPIPLGSSVNTVTPISHEEAIQSEVNRAIENDQAVFMVTEADEFGYVAEVSNGSIIEDGNSVTIVSPDGKSNRLPNFVDLTNGEQVTISYSVQDTRVTAEYSTHVDPELVYNPNLPHVTVESRAGCIGAILLGASAVGGAMIGLASAPLTGPIGPAWAAITMGTAAGSIITAGDLCT